jgi:hypothetical protein
MRTRAFTLAAEAAGLTLRTVSLGGVQLLQEIAARPLLLANPRAIKDPTGKGHLLGPLIRHGLVVLDRNGPGAVYAITDKGTDYLAKLEAAGLLGKGVAA